MDTCYNPRTMYKEFYQLRENPFNITADPHFFFTSAGHEEAFSHLRYGIKQRKGILLITGEIGTGKTILCKKLLNHLDDKTKTALVLNPSFSDVQLLRFIINDFGIQGKLRNKFELINALNQFLLQETQKGNNVVLVIDECQNLKTQQLEQIRLLSNLETTKEKLLQIILVGQPELYDKLKLNALRQLNQRIAVRYILKPLSREETERYISFRINRSKLHPLEQTRATFTKQAINAIFEQSQGTPRMINILCDRALLAGFASELTTLDHQIIQYCIAEVV